MRDLQAEETSFSAMFRRQLSFLTPRENLLIGRNDRSPLEPGCEAYLAD